MTSESMNADEFRKILKEATHKATRVIFEINKENNAEKKDGKRTYEYEATLKAQIYHQLLLSGISARKLRCELKPNVKGFQKKHIDLWFESEDGKEVMIEIKWIPGFNRRKTEFREYDLRHKNGNDKAGIIPDIIKLLEIANQFAKEKDDDSDVSGIIIVSYVGEEHPQGLSNAEETGLIKQLNLALKDEIKNRKGSSKFEPDLVKILMCLPVSYGDSKYHNLDLQPKKIR
ncbi:MAG: hypothetical protein ACYDAZ_08655 [Thermoplasmataceae archaeon]